MKKKYPDIAIDLFASHLNKKCQQFVSYVPLPGAVACNAFTLDWNNYKYPFVFPPFSVIRKTLTYIWTWEVEKVYAIIPWQPSQSWWTHFVAQLMIDVPILFPSSVSKKLRLRWDSITPPPPKAKAKVDVGSFIREQAKTRGFPEGVCELFAN